MSEVSKGCLAEAERLLPCECADHQKLISAAPGVAPTIWHICGIFNRPAVAAALQAKEDRIKVLEAEKSELERFRHIYFTPTGDNHHNADLCPYCSPEGVTQKNRIKVLEAALVDAAENLEGIAELTWDKRDPCRHVCDEASIMAGETAERARSPLALPTAASSGEDAQS